MSSSGRFTMHGWVMKWLCQISPLNRERPGTELWWDSLTVQLQLTTNHLPPNVTLSYVLYFSLFDEYKESFPGEHYCILCTVFEKINESGRLLSIMFYPAFLLEITFFRIIIDCYHIFIETVEDLREPGGPRWWLRRLKLMTIRRRRRAVSVASLT